MSATELCDFTGGDALIDEVRFLRRQVCAAVGNDVDKLIDSLREVERDFAERRGVFACVTDEAVAEVLASWGDDPYRTDDPLIDEVRKLRRGAGRAELDP